MVLAAFIAPVAIGIAINFWKPKVAEKISKASFFLDSEATSASSLPICINRSGLYSEYLS